MTRRLFAKPTVFIFSLVFLMSACVSRPPKTEEPTPSAGPTVSGPNPAPVESSDTPTAPAGRELRGPVTIVLGGAGVASFAAVGILKKFQEDGVQIESIIATGWPAIFAVGYGMMKSVHDLEWFAMRLEQSDFSTSGVFGSDKGFSEHDRIRATVTKAFGGQSLNQTRVPIVLSASNSNTGQPEVYSSGSWLDPLMKVISVPGTFQPFGEGPGLGWVSALSGIDVDEAQRRGARSVAAFAMYDDYLISLGDSRTADSETLFRNLYAAQVSKNIKASIRKATGSAQVRLGRPPLDFSAKRLAIQTGYQEAAKLLRLLARKGS
jgi:hypothetical protein